LIGNGKKHLIPSWQPAGTGEKGEGMRVSRKANRSEPNLKPFRTQHTRHKNVHNKAKKSRQR
jgi:hypothetical protein